MSDALGASIAPGWYDDPAGSGLKRWWSGIGWTEHTHDPAPKPVAPAPSPADDFGYTGGYKPMSSTPGYDQVAVTAGPIGTASGNTFGVWAIALSPFWSWLLFIPAAIYLDQLRCIHGQRPGRWRRRISIAGGVRPAC